MVDPLDLNESALRWIEFILPRLLASRARAERLALRYIMQFRRLELGSTEQFDPGLPTPIPLEAIRSSLWFQGPIQVERSIERLSGLEVSPEVDRAILQRAMDDTADKVAATTLRHVTNGNREAIREAVREDRRALGYARVTRSSPCYFCAMLASRGPVYKSESFEDSNRTFSGAGIAKAHDSCLCSLEPVYSRTAEWPGRGRSFADLWASSTGGKSGREAILAFRRAFEGR